MLSIHLSRSTAVVDKLLTEHVSAIATSDYTTFFCERQPDANSSITAISMIRDQRLVISEFFIVHSKL